MITLSQTPVLETERLVLRAPVAADWPVWRDFHTSERAQFVGGGADTLPTQSWRAFGHVIGHWVMRGFGSFVFTLKGDDAPLGMAGPWFPEGWPEHEIGWTVWDQTAEGKGFAREAAIAARRFARRDLGWTDIVSYIDPANARSIALAERLGARLDRGAALPQTVPPHDDTLVYRHPQEAA